MKGDFSRVSFDRARHARGLLMQQGRVQLDADWNELQEVQSYRVETQATDVIGPAGVPDSGGGFALSLAAPASLTIGQGRIYVDGILAENDNSVQVTAQPFLPGYTMPAKAGCYVAYLDVWLREITALDDWSVREVALGGPDTALRESVAWQVKLLRVGDHDPGATCATSGGLDTLRQGAPRTLRARARTGSAGTDPCNIAPDAAFRGVENQLYRVEIHQGGPAASATFKWSRDNGSLVAAWLPDNVGVNRIKVGGVGRDGMPGFAPNQWVELYDDTNVLYDDTTVPQHDVIDPAGHPGALVQIDTVEDQVLVLKSAPPARGGDNPKVRGWDMPTGAIGLGQTTTVDGFIDLESGLQVQFDTSAVYTAGDYWLIPARTIIADIYWPGTGNAPGSKPPDGVRHHYAALAVLTTADGQSWELLDDCRPTFPPLTAIQAEDVLFDNVQCAIPGAGTVQEALDALCTRTDLRAHNQRLHGWGIVCGLAVRCGPNGDGQIRKHVTVEPGYAIDAQGNDVNVTEEITVDVLDWVDRLKNVLDANGDGELCLILDPMQSPDPIRAEKFDPAQDEQSLLAGTLLNDFYMDCVKPVWDFLLAELSGDKDHPADATQQRRSTLITLANQVINPVSGQEVYISQREDTIIRDFYNGLRSLLTSHTFCAMFENARKVPDYPLADVHMDTIFGTGSHNRLRLHPGGSEAYTFGPGAHPLQPQAQINRYNLDQGLLVAEINPVAGTQRTTAFEPASQADTGTGAVQDVAFSPDGTRIYVAIASRNEDNTIFRSGTVSGSGIAWDSPVTICGIKLVSLATTAADAKFVYAVGQHKVATTNKKGQTSYQWQGVGLLRINPDQIDPSNVPQVSTGGVTPTGPMLIDAAGHAVLAGTPAGADATNYTQLVQANLPPGASNQATVDWQVTLNPSGSDGIGFVTEDGSATPSAVYVVLAGSDTAHKQIVGYRMTDGHAIAPQGSNQTPATTVGLAGAQGLLLVSEADANAVEMIDPQTAAFVTGYVLPTQVGPAAIAASAAGRVVVLNQVSNTLTVISPDLVTRSFVFPSQKLVDYRAAMLNAFADLAAGFLQYLKDCLCDHFLVNCPPPDAQHPLRLGCVSIRNTQVYKICNFTGRKYVKSFPTVGYWLSLIPIQPLIARLVELFCCAVLPEMASKISVADSSSQTVGSDMISMSTLLRLIETAQSHNLPASLREIRSRFDIVGQTAKLAARAITPTVPPPGGAAVSASTIVGQPAEQVVEALQAQGVTVRRATFDPRPSSQVFGTVAGLFRNPQPGQEVTLCEEGGQVRFFSVTTPSPLTGRVRNLEASMATQGQELSQMQDTVATARAEAEALSAQLAQARSDLDQRDQALAGLSARLDVLERERGTPAG
jgi:DNA-binding beta-propeller fold protein YncE